MGFSIVCERQGATDMLTSTVATETSHTEKGHYQRSAACDTLAHTLRALLRPLGRGLGAVEVQR